MSSQDAYYPALRSVYSYLDSFANERPYSYVTWNFAHKEVTHMQCASCGRKIKGEPVWVDGEAYCSQDCADMDSAENEGTESEQEEEEKW